MRLAYASPLPPQKTGIADYSAELLPHLARHAEIVLFVETPETETIETWSAAGFEIYPLGSLPRRCGDFDLVLYQMGNDARYHGGIWRMLQQLPGVVVLHEFMLHHLVREMTLVRGDVAGYLEEHRYCYGENVYRVAKWAVESSLPHDIWSYPLFERVIDRSLGVIVHNEATRSRVAASRPESRIAKVPHHLALSTLPDPASISAAEVRRRLGVPEDAFVVASFGLITPAKRIEVALRAFARLRRRVPEAFYLLVGEVSPYYDLDRLLEPELRSAVRVTGRLPLSDLLAIMVATDVAVNLRHPTGGETSGVLIRLLGLGRPVVVSKTGSFREIPDGCCAKVALDETEEDVLAAFLLELAGNPELRERMGRNARHHMARYHTLEGSAQKYAAFLREIVRSGSTPPPPVAPLTPWPDFDVFTDLVSDVGAAAADLGLTTDDSDLLNGVAEQLVDLDLDRAAGMATPCAGVETRAGVQE